MTDILIIVLVVTGIFGLGLLFSSGFTIFKAWKKAKSFGLNPTFNEAKALAKFYQVEEHFLKSCAEFKKLDPSISIEDVVRHHMADGDTLALLDDWKQVIQSGAKMSFESAVLLHLAGKDIHESIAALGKIHEIYIPEIEQEGFKIEYFCQFKISPDSASWVVINQQDISEKVIDKVVLALLTGDLTDIEDLTEFIKEKYLNDKFWDEICHGIIINQNLKIVQ